MASSLIHIRPEGRSGLLHTNAPDVVFDYRRCEEAATMTMDYRLSSRTSFTHLEPAARDSYGGNEGPRYGPGAEQGLGMVSPGRLSTVGNGNGGGGCGGNTSSSSGDESSGSGHRSCNDVTTENRTGTGSSGNDGRPEVGGCFGGGGAMMTKTDDEEDSSREMSRQWTEEETLLLTKGFPEEGSRKNKAQKQVSSFHVNKTYVTQNHQ